MRRLANIQEDQLCGTGPSVDGKTAVGILCSHTWNK